MTIPQSQSSTVHPDPFDGTSYRAVSRIATGAMGEVFVVEHRSLGTHFAAKLLHSRLCSDVALVERVRVEAECLGALRHANVVSVVDFSHTTDGCPFIVMEYLRGRTLEGELAERGALEPSEALELVTQLLSALDAAHRLGIVHRDLKPSNLFLCDAEASPARLKVLDFGVARVLPDASADGPRPLARSTATGTVIGSPFYLSPEGALGERVDGRADLYATALILYLMLAGRGPFDAAQQEGAVLPPQVYRDPPPPSTWARHLDERLDAIVMKGLRRSPAERYQTAAEFQQSVDEYVASEPFVSADEIGASAPKSSRPAASVVLSVIGIVVAVAVVLALIVISREGF
jgi:serine/threonine-protein kinase